MKVVTGANDLAIVDWSRSPWVLGSLSPGPDQIGQFHTGRDPLPYQSRRTRLLIAASATAVVAALAPAAVTHSADATGSVFAPQLVTVDTPTRAHKQLLQTLGLDLTEHAGHDYVEVVLHTAADADALHAAGLTYDVRIPDLVAREAANNRANAQYAAATAVSPLPSGRDTYRSLADYNAEMQAMAQANPDLVRLFELPRKSLDGRTIYGIELAANVTAKDGRPTFLLMGLHHAREWPSGEHAMEFAIDMLEGYQSGDPRRTALLQQGRLVVVPVVNVDGFHLSYEDGQKVDLREVDGGGTVTILGTPGNAYKRKNCRVVDGQDTVDGTCAVFSATSPGGFGIGVDLNRNYGGLWGGPGAADLFADPTYRGAGPFSEPETQNVRDFIAGRQVTMMISNHTFSNLVLRPNGVDPANIGPDGKPVGNAPDEEAMKALGAEMTAQNGYRNIHGWQLYDTTGTTEDWSYNATGGYGYTFEIGPEEFHPPFPEVVDEYLGTGTFAGKGNRAAYLIAFEEAVDRTSHSVIAGKAPNGATLRLTKQFETQTWDNAANFQDRLDSTMVVNGGKFTWDVNPSTRPAVSKRLVEILGTEPVRTQEYRDRPAPLFNQYAEEQFTVTETGLDLLKVDLNWPTSAADDLDLVVYWMDPNGRRVEVGSSGNAPGQAESAKVADPEPGTYIFEVHNYASTSPTYNIVASLYDAVGTEEVGSGIAEWWTLTCEKPTATGLKVLEQRSVYVERGQQVKVDLRECSRRWKSVL